MLLAFAVTLTTLAAADVTAGERPSFVALGYVSGGFEAAPTQYVRADEPTWWGVRKGSTGFSLGVGAELRPGEQEPSPLVRRFHLPVGLSYVRWRDADGVFTLSATSLNLGGRFDVLLGPIRPVLGMDATATLVARAAGDTAVHMGYAWVGGLAARLGGYVLSADAEYHSEAGTAVNSYLQWWGVRGSLGFTF